MEKLTKKDKKKSWKERQRQRQLKKQRAHEAYERQRAIEAEKKPRQWPKGKIIAGVCLLSVIFIAYGAWQLSLTGTTNNPQPTGSAPNFSLRDINGAQFSLNQFSGKVIAIHFMTVGCHGQIPPIDDNQLRQLKSICKNYCGSKQFAMITVVASTCQTSDLSQIRSDYGITWHMGNDYDDGRMEIFDAYAKHSIQDGTIVLIDKPFNVARVHTESMTADALLSEIGQLLEA